MNVKTIATAVIAGALSLTLLTACGGDASGAEPPPRSVTSSSTVSTAMTTTSAAPPSTKSPGNGEGQEIVDLLLASDGIELDPSFANGFGNLVCQGFRDGNNALESVEYAYAGTKSLGYTKLEVAAMVGTATGVKCPQFLDGNF